MPPHSRGSAAELAAEPLTVFLELIGKAELFRTPNGGAEKRTRRRRGEISDAFKTSGD